MTLRLRASRSSLRRAPEHRRRSPPAIAWPRSASVSGSARARAGSRTMPRALLTDDRDDALMVVSGHAHRPAFSALKTASPMPFRPSSLLTWALVKSANVVWMPSAGNRAAQMRRGPSFVDQRGGPDRPRIRYRRRFAVVECVYRRPRSRVTRSTRARTRPARRSPRALTSTSARNARRCSSRAASLSSSDRNVPDDAQA